MRLSNDTLRDALLFLPKDSLDVTCIVSRKFRRVTESLTTSSQRPMRPFRIGQLIQHAESVSETNILVRLNILSFRLLDKSHNESSEAASVAVFARSYYLML